MRYLWDMYHEYFRATTPLVRFFMKRLIPSLRIWDVTSANLVDRFIANSGYVAKRIRRYYNREAPVIHPPVDVEKYLGVERRPQGFYLFFGSLSGYKRADIAIEACVKSERKLVVAGAGAKHRKNGLVTFLGKVSDGDIFDLFASAKALVFPGIEDFGIIPVEAQAAGCPVIVYRDGGALETVKEGVTGLFFDEQTPGALIAAMERFERNEVTFAGREVFKDHVQQFSRATFIKRIQNVLDERRRI
jgi:glycosyltransferase involved in cell wall biosynthesis